MKIIGEFRIKYTRNLTVLECLKMYRIAYYVSKILRGLDNASGLSIFWATALLIDFEFFDQESLQKSITIHSYF